MFSFSAAFSACVENMQQGKPPDGIVKDSLKVNQYFNQGCRIEVRPVPAEDILVMRNRWLERCPPFVVARQADILETPGQQPASMLAVCWPGSGKVPQVNACSFWRRCGSLDASSMWPCSSSQVFLCSVHQVPTEAPW